MKRTTKKAIVGHMTLSITAQQTTSRSTVLVLDGALDCLTAADLRAAISAAVARQPSPLRIFIDLHAVTDIDDTGVGTLIVAGRICRDIGIDLALRHPSPLIRQLMGMADHTAGGPHPARRTAKINGDNWLTATGR
jgi:anti-anti-sigma factor